jgi:predicted RNA binding protein YcfA (HicA-like mRNA interferase family)
MTKLPLISSDAVIQKLKKNGFEVAPHQCKGSHIALFIK